MAGLVGLLWVLIPVLTMGQMNCAVYGCRPANVTFANNTCVMRETGKVMLQPCNEHSANSFCDVNSGKCVPPTVTKLQSYPGEPCNTQSDCAYGQCTNSVCVGTGLGLRCSKNEECAPGLYCSSSSVCTAQLAVGSSCTTDYQCVSYAGCVNRNCTAYYSLPVNSTVPDCGSNSLSNFCESMACAKSGWLGTTGTCVSVKKSAHPMPQPCTSNANCTATDNTPGTCSCGYNSRGIAYCQPNLGDSQGLWLIQAYRNAVSRSNGACNTVRRLSQYCWMAINEWENVKTQYWNFYYLPLLQGNDRCVSETFNQAYWTDLATYVTAGTALLVAFS